MLLPRWCGAALYLSTLVLAGGTTSDAPTAAADGAGDVDASAAAAMAMDASAAAAASVLVATGVPTTPPSPQ